MLGINELRDLVCWRKNNAEKGVGLEKIPQKIQQESQANGAMKSIKNLGGWKRIITVMQKEKKIPNEPVH